MKFRKKNLFTTLIIFALISLLGCNKESSSLEKSEKIYLKDFEWSETTIDSNIIDADKLEYKPFVLTSKQNIFNLVGSNGNYIWLRTIINIPEELKNQNLYLCIPRVHFSDKVYFNNSYLGEYGSFPNKESSESDIGIPASYEPQIFCLENRLINYDTPNYLYIKVYALGNSFISDNSFIAQEQIVKNYSKRLSLLNSKIYIFFIGICLSAFIVYLLLFCQRPVEKEYICFTIINLYSIMFMSYFCYPEISNIFKGFSNYLWTIKVFVCSSFYTMNYFLSSFMIRFLKIKQSKKIIVIRLIVWAFTQIYTLIQPTYTSLMSITPYMLILSFFQNAYCLSEIYYILKNKDTYKRAIIFIIGLSPLLIGITLDLIFRFMLKNTYLPFLSLFGWTTSIIMYLIFLTVNFSKILRNNEYLTQNLQKEIHKKTLELTKNIYKLSNENEKSQIELKMAGIVQQKALPPAHKSFIGWDVSINYSPLTEVSGDFYDYYNIGNNLDGFSIFDVSGHGIASSLVTMIAKNIVSQTFANSRFSNVPKKTNQLLLEINNKIIDAKGNIDNYLTGLLFKISNINDNEMCHIEFSNAGHPHPLLYKDKERVITELVCQDKSTQYGAIGLKDLAVSFQNINFDMSIGDILVCFTDGLVETMNRNRERFSKEKVKEIIANNHFMTTKEIQETLKKEFTKFLDGEKVDDDITVMILKRESRENFIEELAELNEDSNHTNITSKDYIPEL